MITKYLDFINEHFTVDSRGDYIYYLPLDFIWKYREFDRLDQDKLYPDEYINSLFDDIKENGIKQPITLQIDLSVDKALVVEGNHRIGIAKKLGINTIPTKVVFRCFGSINEHKALPIIFDRQDWKDGIFQ